MFNAFLQIHWFAVVIATFACSALGALWFTRVAPGYYVIALGRENAPARQQAPRDYVVQLVCTLANVITSAILLRALEVRTVEHALSFGAVVGLGYLVAMTFNIAINPNFPRPLLYGAINAPFFVLGSLMTSVILVLMR